MILAIDTSTAHTGIAVYNGCEVLGEYTWASPSRQTAALAPAVRDLLNKLEIDRKDLKALAVALGPGSFTGLRVGLSFAKGMSLGLGIPVIGIPTLDVTAYQQPVEDLPLCAFLQAGRGKLAASFYRKKAGRWGSSRVGDGKIEVFTIQTLAERITEPTVLCGEFSTESWTEIRRLNKNIKTPSPASNLRRAGYLAELGWKVFKQGEYPPVSSLKPIYLHTQGEAIPD